MAQTSKSFFMTALRSTTRLVNSEKRLKSLGMVSSRHFLSLALLTSYTRKQQDYYHHQHTILKALSQISDEKILEEEHSPRLDPVRNFLIPIGPVPHGVLVWSLHPRMCINFASTTSRMFLSYLQFIGHTYDVRLQP